MYEFPFKASQSNVDLNAEETFKSGKFSNKLMG
jgi:hypothetical protein